jgi:hypothetical protein
VRLLIVAKTVETAMNGSTNKQTKKKKKKARKKQWFA